MGLDRGSRPPWTLVRRPVDPFQGGHMISLGPTPDICLTHTVRPCAPRRTTPYTTAAIDGLHARSMVRWNVFLPIPCHDGLELSLRSVSLGFSEVPTAFCAAVSSVGRPWQGRDMRRSPGCADHRPDVYGRLSTNSPPACCKPRYQRHSKARNCGSTDGGTWAHLKLS